LTHVFKKVISARFDVVDKERNSCVGLTDPLVLGPALAMERYIGPSSVRRLSDREAP
jgi:hypothetical protein